MNNSYIVNLYPQPTGEADQRLTVSSSVVSLDPNWTSSKTKFILLDIQTNDVMVTFDGSNPSSTNGHLYKAGVQPFLWNKETARLAKFIRAGGSDGVVHATPFSV